MTSTDRTASTPTRLRLLADMIEAHPDLPPPYISAYSSGTVDAHWYLHINGGEKDLPAQKTTAARIVSDLGGQWDKSEDSDTFRLTQNRDGISLKVAVSRAAVCERVVIGTHDVTVSATPAVPASPGVPESVQTIEDVEWRCSSLLADAS